MTKPEMKFLIEKFKSGRMTLIECAEAFVFWNYSLSTESALRLIKLQLEEIEEYN